MAKVTQHVPKDQAIADTCGVGRARGHSVKPPKTKTSLSDWHEYLEIVAVLVLEDPVYIPIFNRIEAEIARKLEQEDVISRARKIAGAAGPR